MPSGSGMEDVPVMWRFQTHADCMMSAHYLNKERVRSPWRYVCEETDPARLAELQRAMEPAPAVVSRALTK